MSDKKPSARLAAGQARVKRGLDRVRRATADAQAAAAPAARKTVNVVGQGASVAHGFFRDAGRATSKTTNDALEGVVRRARSSVGGTNESVMRFLAARHRDSKFVLRAGGGAALAWWPALDAQWLKDLLQAGSTVSTPTAWDRAMDAVCNAGREHGNLHRLFDGGHSVTGAFEAGWDVGPDTSWIENVGGTLSANLERRRNAARSSRSFSSVFELAKKPPLLLEPTRLTEHGGSIHRGSTHGPARP